MKTASFIQAPRQFARIAAGGVIIAGALVLLGWGLDIAALKSVVAGWPKMVPLAALGFLLSGFSLWNVAGRENARRRRTAQVCAAVVALIGLSQICNLTFGWGLHFELLGFNESLAAGETPAQMAAATALNFLLLGGALLFAGRPRRFVIFQTLIFLGGAISWLGCLHFLYGGEPLLPLGQMSLVTAFCLVLLTAGIFCARTDRGLMALFVSASAGGLLVRRLLLAAVIIPFLVGWVRWRLQVAGWFGTEAGIALFGLANVILFAALIWRNADLLQRADVERKLTGRQLDESFQEIGDLKSALDEHAIVAITDPQGKIISVNDKFCAISKYSRAELLGQDHRLINSGFHSKAFIRDLWTTISNGKVWHGDIKNKAKDGSFYWVATTIVPFLNEQGKPRQYVAIREDITERKLAELTQLRLAAIVNSSEDAIIGKTLAGIITSWNPGAEKMFGFPAAEAIGQPMLMLFPPERAHEEPEILAKIGRGESVRHFETVRVCKDGKRLDVSIAISPITDREGKIIGASKIARDITERKLAATKLQRSEHEQRQLAQQLAEEKARLIEAQTVGKIGSWETDMVTGAVKWSEETHRIFETDPNRFRPTHQDFLQIVHPDDRVMVDEAFARSVAACTTGAIMHRLLLPDGRIKWVEERWQVFPDEQGQPGRAVGMCRDITESMQAERALRESQALYASLVEQMPAGVFRKDAAGRYVFVNAYFLGVRGATAEQFLGKLPEELPASEAKFITQAASHHEEIFRTGQPLSVVDEYRHADGRTLFFHVVKSPVFNAEREIIGTQGMLFDVTARKQAEDEVRRLNAELEQRVIERTAQLEAANQELEAFSYSVSHDLRAPLRAVNGFAGIVLEDFGPQLPAEGRRYLERIRTGGQQMGVLIDDLLAFSRLSRQPMDRHAVDMAKLVKNVLEELKPQHAGRELEWKLGHLPPCDGDAALLQQVWVNLISNAIKYSRGRKPAVVEIGYLCDSGASTYFIRDNGTGFDMQYAHKLFGVFQRLHRADEFEGTGVGLAIVQRIIHRHGGRVWAEAKENAGATFYFTLKGALQP